MSPELFVLLVFAVVIISLLAYYRSKTITIDRATFNKVFENGHKQTRDEIINMKTELATRIDRLSNQFQVNVDKQIEDHDD